MLAGDERKADQIAQGVGHGDIPWLTIASHCVRSSVLRSGFRPLSVLIHNTALNEETFILLRCVPNPFSCQDKGEPSSPVNTKRSMQVVNHIKAP